MNFFKRLFSWPRKSTIRQLEEVIEENQKDIESVKPMVEEASRRTEASARELTTVVHRAKRRTEVGRRLIDDLESGMRRHG